MAAADPFQEMIEEREKQKEEALGILKAYKEDKVTLRRPVFFVPGWTDESCGCWSAAYRKNTAMKEWIDAICINPYEARYVKFEEESPSCRSFLDFGEVLKKKIWSDIGKDREFDLVGHSMGGLDIRAALALGELLSQNHNCLTVATPHQGDNLGGINVWSRNTFLGRALIGWILHQDTPYHREQSKGLDPDYEPIKIINRTENKLLFLQRVSKLYEFKGTRDFTVKDSAYIDKSDIPLEYRSSKIEDIEIGGADHTGKLGITQDPRTVLSIISILLGRELEKPEYNKGFL